jgi:hypothetical protein
MKARYRLFLRRKSVYYAFDTTTRKFQSLQTKNRKEAERLTSTLNEAGKQPAMNLRLARVYLQHSDPAFSSRVPVDDVFSSVSDSIGALLRFFIPINKRSGPTDANNFSDEFFRK